MTVPPRAPHTELLWDGACCVVCACYCLCEDVCVCVCLYSVCVCVCVCVCRVLHWVQASDISSIFHWLLAPSGEFLRVVTAMSSGRVIYVPSSGPLLSPWGDPVEGVSSPG